jgi:hypothetical protein
MPKITSLEYYKFFYTLPVPFRMLKEEQKICVEFSNYLREQTIKGNFPYIWFHIPNEFYKTKGKEGMGGLFGSILTAMGRISGAPDYCFIGKDHSFFIEFKSKSGRLFTAQKFFERWCKEKEVNYFLCRSAKEGIEIVEANMLKNKREQ